jgi:conjugal transfer mating pair stabilization protein TraG
METLTVYAYGNVDALHGIFNAVAMIMSASSFQGMLRIGMVVGFLVVAAMAVAPENFKRGPYWFICVCLVSLVMVAPKARVSIVDHLGQQAPVVVDKVPYVLALAASVKTSIGSTLTQAFETAFQTIPGRLELPSELSYIEHGVMCGSRLVRTSREVGFSSLYTQGDTYNYLRNCIFPSQGRDHLADQIESSTDLKTVYANPNPALGSAYHDPSNNFALVFDTCDRVYTALASQLNQEGLLAVRRAAKRTFPDLPAATAQTKLESSLMAIYDKAAIAGAATSASEIMLQNILINATADASALYAASLNDPSLMMFSSMRSQAVGQMNAGNLVAGRIAEEALPIVRNTVDAILYAVFPIICILAVMSEARTLGAMLKGYLMTLAWVELWPPLFAVTNYLQTQAAAKNLAAAGLTQAGKGLTLATATGIYSTAVSDVAVAAYMVTAVPIIAAACVWGMEKITSVAGAAIGTRQAQQEAAAGSKGNLSAGNVSLQQQQLASQITEPHVATRSGIGGTESMNLLTGERISQQASSRFVVTMEDVSSVGQQLSQQAAISTERSTASRKAYDVALDTAFGQALTLARSGSAGAQRSVGFDIAKVGSDGLMQGEVEETAKRISRDLRLDDSSAVEKALKAGLSGSSLKAFAADFQGSTAEREQISKALSSGVEALRKSSSQRKAELVDKVQSGSAFEEARRSNREASRRLESSTREVEGWRQSSTDDLVEAQRANEAFDKHRAFSRTSRSDWANHFDRFLQGRGISVTGGIANTAEMQRLMRDFVVSGELVEVDGENRWIPDQNIGPRIVQETFSPITTDRLRDLHHGSQPGAGRTGVQRTAAANDAAVRAAQRAAGVSPDMRVSGSDIQGQVANVQRAAAERHQRGRDAALSNQGELQGEMDERASRLSPYHAPMGGSRNRALDAAHNIDGTETRPFKSEAEAAQVKREAATKAFLENRDRAQIPGQGRVN